MKAIQTKSRTSSSTVERLLLIATLLVVMESVSTKQVAITAGGNHGNVTSQRTSYPAMKAGYAYLRCYLLFTDGVQGKTCHEMCKARDKLNLCKQTVKAAFPKVENYINKGMSGEYEYVAEYWCTYKPPPYWPIEALCYKYDHCPYIHPEFLVLPEDYSVQEWFTLTRQRFATDINSLVNIPHLKKWHPKHNYSDPSDPVYQALSAKYCAWHQFHLYRAEIVGKYCYILDIYRDFTGKLLHYQRQEMDGLYNWSTSACPSEPEDPVEKMLNILELETYLKQLINSSLDQCHPNNVAVIGGSCLIRFHTQHPPFSDLNLFMKGFCKPIKELYQCWEQVVQMCPKETANSDMDVLMKLHQLACDLSLQNSSLVWDVIYRWSDAVRKVKGSQYVIQQVSVITFRIDRRPYSSNVTQTFPFASTLNATLATQTEITPQLWSMLKKLVSYLDRICLFQTFRFLGLNVLFELYIISDDGYAMAQLISEALNAAIGLFFTIGGFIDYDPTNFEQWRPLVP